MLHFWLEVLLRAFLDTLAGIGKDPAELRFSACVFVFVTVLLLIRNRRKGLRAWVENVKQRFWGIVGEDIVIIAGLIVVIVVYNVLREPFVAWDGERKEGVRVKGELDGKVSELNECSANLRTEQVKSRLLGNQITTQQTQISGQQTMIQGQQSTSATQQSTFNLCVTTLANVNAPVPQHTAVVFANDDPPTTAKGIHTKLLLLVTNKPITPARFLIWCDGSVKDMELRSANDQVYSGGLSRIKGKGIFQPSDRWELDYAIASWTPEAPLIINIFYDADDVGKCYASPI